jgi:hypothetical protein
VLSGSFCEGTLTAVAEGVGRTTRPVRVWSTTAVLCGTLDEGENDGDDDEAEDEEGGGSFVEDNGGGLELWEEESACDTFGLLLGVGDGECEGGGELLFVG